MAAASGKNLFGNPTAYVAAIQAGLVMLLAFGKLDFLGLHSQDDIAVVAVALNALGALYLAWITTRTMLAPVIEAFKAMAALAAVYGFHMSTEQTGTAIMFITAIFAAFHWQSTSPLAEGSLQPE